MSVIAQNRSFEKPVPHPILDDASKMMRIIANPVYDRLTLSRAANVRKYNPTNPIQQAPQFNRFKERIVFSPFKSSDIEETTITPLPNLSETSSDQSQSKHSSKLQVPPAFRLPSALPSNQRLPRSLTPAARSRVSTARSRASTARPRTTAGRFRANSARLTIQSIQDELIADTANIQKPIADGTIRYVNSRHGFEVQHYSSSNWLSTDVYTKETCQDHEKTFREMLERKRHYERLSRNIYSSEYYSNRWNELLQSFKQDHLTHAEWAKQNYQLFFLKTLYTQAVKREQREKLEQRGTNPNGQVEPQTQNTLNESKDIKHDENSEHHHNRLNTPPHSHNILDEASFLSNNSFTFPMSNTVDDNHTYAPNKTRLKSISIYDDTEFPRSTLYSSVTPSKMIADISTLSKKSKAFYMVDKKRWSLNAMVKRVVGLADELPTPPKLTDGGQSSMITTNIDCDI